MGANQKRRYLKIALPTGTASKLWNERQLCLLPVQDTGQAIEIKDLIYWNYVFFWHGNPVFKWPNNSVSLVNVMLKGILKDPSPANNLPRCSARPVSREEGEPRIKKWRIDIIYIYRYRCFCTSVPWQLCKETVSWMFISQWGDAHSQDTAFAPGETF